MAHTRWSSPWAAAALALLASGCARGGGLSTAASGRPAHRPGFEAELRAEGRAGSVTGFVQTPKGGAPGTTSLGRPTFDEVGVEVAWAPVADLRLAWRRHRVHIGGALWVLHGDEKLQEPLITHDKSYAAGIQLTSETEVGTTWAGYGYALDLSRQPGRVTLTPGVGVFGYSLAYQVSGGGQTSTREFSAYSPMVDAELAWYPGGRIHVSAEGRLVLDDLIGKRSPTTVYEGALRLHLDLWRQGDLFFSVGLTHIDHHDHQEVPNDAVVDVVPWFGLGGSIRF